MTIERLRLANNGLVEVHSEGPMCWYDDCETLQCKLDEVTRERDQLRAMLTLADALRNHERGSS